MNYYNAPRVPARKLSDMARHAMSQKPLRMRFGVSFGTRGYAPGNAVVIAWSRGRDGQERVLWACSNMVEDDDDDENILIV